MNGDYTNVALRELPLHRSPTLALTHMWNGPVSKFPLRNSPSDGAVICPACRRGHKTAGHDEIRDADRLIIFARSEAH
jgi:hypothetical protein